MVTDMLSLRALFRCFILTFCVVVFVLGVAVYCNTRTQDTSTRGNLLAFLFTRSVEEAPVLHSQTLPQQETVQEPKPEPVVTPQPPADATWKPVPHGKQPGNGSLGKPTIDRKDNGSVEVLIPYKGRLGQCSTFRPEGFTYGRSVNLYGAWKNASNVRRPIASGNITLVQTGVHKQMFRISCTGKNAPITAEVTASADTVRIVFHSSPARGK